MSSSYVNDFRINVFAAGKGAVTEENNITNEPQRRVTRAQTRARNESEQVGPVFFSLCPTKITVKQSSCWQLFVIYRV
jgi:hypothetical protein